MSFSRAMRAGQRVQIVQMTERDAHALAEMGLTWRLASDGPAFAPRAESLLKALGTNRTGCWVAYVGDQMSGCAVTSFTNRTARRTSLRQARESSPTVDLILDELFVAKGVRRSGIATALVSKAATVAALNSATSVLAEAFDQHSEKFFARLGFTSDNRREFAGLMSNTPVGILEQVRQIAPAHCPGLL